MKIGIDARMYGQKQTGIGIYIENLIKNILKIDSKNEYVLFLNDPIEEARNQFDKYGNIKLVIANIPWYSYGEQTVFPFLIGREKLDLIHFPHFNVPIFCPVKFVVTIHDMTPKYFPGNKVGRSFFRRKIFDLVMKRALEKSEKIIAVSNFTKDEILKFYPRISGDKVRVIYEGIREEFFPPAPVEYVSSETFASLPAASLTAISENLFSDISQEYQKTPSKFSSIASSDTYLIGAEQSIRPSFRERCGFEETGAGEKDWLCSESRFFAEPVTGVAAGAVNCGSEKPYPDRLKAIISCEKFIFYTGVWRNHKNLVGLIRAFKILKDKYKIPHKLVLGGSEDPNYLEVRKEWEKLGLEKDIILTGFLDLKDQIFLYKSCDLYVSPSFCEGFGFTPLEAMSQGAAVALSDIPAHREISGDLPVYFDPKNPENMAEKIYFALNDKDFRDKIISIGPEFVKKYQWQNCTKETLTKVYNYDKL